MGRPPPLRLSESSKVLRWTDAARHRRVRRHRHRPSSALRRHHRERRDSRLPQVAGVGGKRGCECVGSKRDQRWSIEDDAGRDRCRHPRRRPAAFENRLYARLCKLGMEERKALGEKPPTFLGIESTKDVAQWIWESGFVAVGMFPVLCTYIQSPAVDFSTKHPTHHLSRCRHSSARIMSLVASGAAKHGRKRCKGAACCTNGC